MYARILVLVCTLLCYGSKAANSSNYTDPYAVDNAIYPVCANVTYKYSEFGYN